MIPKVEYCNWTFIEVVRPYEKWVVARDCDNYNEADVDDDSNTFTITRDSPKANWQEYKKSLEPYPQGQPRRGHCPKCGKNINGVNSYDDGETWRR